jgi:hypothetical protein
VAAKWSKLKQTVEARFADSIAGRVRLFMTGYHFSHNEVGRWAVVIDGEEAGGIGEITSWQNNRWFKEPGITQEEAAGELRAKGLHTRDHFVDALREYLSLPIEKALDSPDVVIRSLAILDSRTGKRRLRAICERGIDHTLERQCLALRCEADGVRAGAACTMKKAKPTPHNAKPKTLLPDAAERRKQVLKRLSGMWADHEDLPSFEEVRGSWDR